MERAATLISKPLPVKTDRFSKCTFKSFSLPSMLSLLPLKELAKDSHYETSASSLFASNECLVISRLPFSFPQK
jgi:hypothetical protein